MCRKLIFVCVLLLGLVSNSYGVLVGNWEGNMDGWVNENPANVTISYDTMGTTLGSASLRVVGSDVGSGNWYIPALNLPLSEGQVNGILNYTEEPMFKIDVTRSVAEWSLGRNGEGLNWWIPESRVFFSLNASAQNEDGEWAYYGGGTEVLAGAWYPGTLALLDPARIAPAINGNVPMHDVTWSLAAAKVALQGMIDAGYDQNMSVSISLKLNAPGYLVPGPYYLDNARLIPEPATVALLGLGGLALLRRKH